MGSFNKERRETNGNHQYTHRLHYDLCSLTAEYPTYTDVLGNVCSSCGVATLAIAYTMGRNKDWSTSGFFSVVDETKTMLTEKSTIPESF